MKLLVVFTFLFSTWTLAQTEDLSEYKIRGQVLERGTKKKLKQVNVFFLPQQDISNQAKQKLSTDDQARFEQEHIKAGSWKIVIVLSNYQKYEKTLEIQKDSEITIFLEKESYLSSFETVVKAKGQKEDLIVKSLSQEEFKTMPGAGGDPVKAVQNLPGVARTGFSSQVIIQGSSPQSTQYLINDHEVPLVFHFGGLTSVIMPEAVERVDYLSAGYDAEFGSALGGVINLKTRDPDAEQSKGLAFMDFFKVGALYETPINSHSSYLVSGRYSYLGLILAAALKGSDQFDLTVAPTYYDFTSLYHNDLSSDSKFDLSFILSHDELSFLFKQPVKTDPSIRGKFDNQTSFMRLIPHWTYKLNDEEKIHISAGVGRDATLVDFGSNYFDVAVWEWDHRFDFEKKITPNWTTHLGLDQMLSLADYSFVLPSFYSQGGVSNPASMGSTQNANQSRGDVDTGIYIRNTYKLDSNWSLFPSLRWDHYTETHEILTSPRFSVLYQMQEDESLKLATGIYYQQPQPQEIDSTYGNPNLQAPRAYHAALTYEKDFRGGNPRGWTLSTGPFYRYFDRQVITSSNYVSSFGVLVPEKYNNNGTGQAYGLETLIKIFLKPWQFQLSYTLSKSERTEPSVGSHPFQYDQTHNFNLIGAYESGAYKFAGRLRYVTGNPLTPVVGAYFDADNDNYTPTRGPIYSARYSPFFSLDIRIDRKWIYDTWILSAYLDVQNITNQQNPESISYSYNYGTSKSVTGLPVLPTLGVQGEF